MADTFPYPQTYGRTRELNTVPITENVALPRLTQTEGVSLFTQVANYVNNWLGNIPQANAVKNEQSNVMAAKINAGELSTSSPSLVDIFTSSANKMKTIADEWLEAGGYTVSRVDPAAVPGTTPAPQTTQYQYPNLIDQKIQNVVSAWGQLTDQVKGMFNLAYEKPMTPTAVAASDVGMATSTVPWLWIGLGLLALMVLK
jgi:hypothetical protein